MIRECRQNRQLSVLGYCVEGSCPSSLPCPLAAAPPPSEELIFGLLIQGASPALEAQSHEICETPTSFPIPLAYENHLDYRFDPTLSTLPRIPLLLFHLEVLCVPNLLDPQPRRAHLAIPATSGSIIPASPKPLPLKCVPQQAEESESQSTESLRIYHLYPPDIVFLSNHNPLFIGPVILSPIKGEPCESHYRYCNQASA